MIFIVNILDRYKNPLSEEVLISAPTKRELCFRLADLVDCVEACETEDGDWILKGLDVLHYSSTEERLDYCEEACLYANVREMSLEELEEYLECGKLQKPYLSILKCHLKLKKYQ